MTKSPFSLRTLRAPLAKRTLSACLVGYLTDPFFNLKFKPNKNTCFSVKTFIFVLWFKHVDFFGTHIKKTLQQDVGSQQRATVETRSARVHHEWHCASNLRPVDGTRRLRRFDKLSPKLHNSDRDGIASHQQCADSSQSVQQQSTILSLAVSFQPCHLRVRDARLLQNITNRHHQCVKHWIQNQDEP